MFIWAFTFGVPGDINWGWAVDHGFHVAIGVLDFGFPLDVVSAVFSVALNTDVIEANFLIWRVMAAAEGLFVHNVW